MSESRRGTVFLGDLIRALTTLGHDQPALRRLIARQLGLHGMTLPTTTSMPGVYSHDHAPVSAPAGEREPRSQAPAEPRKPPPGLLPSFPPSGARLAIDIDVQPSEAEPHAPSWIRQVELPPRRQQQYRPAPAPIIPSIQTRGVIAAAVSIRREEGPVDVERVIEHLTSIRPLVRLPRMPVPTLRSGCQLLLDRAESMAPFADDVAGLADAVESIVGREQTEILDFIGCPTRGVRPAMAERPERWRRPPTGKPLIILSDLGIGGPMLSTDRAALDEWEAFAEAAEAARCPAVVLVPFHPARWPRRLADRLLLVHWDRSTTAGTLRRGIGPGHEIPR